MRLGLFTHPPEQLLERAGQTRAVASRVRDQSDQLVVAELPDVHVLHGPTVLDVGRGTSAARSGISVAQPSASSSKKSKASAGKRGPQGKTGPVGPTGPAGPQGAKGADGAPFSLQDKPDWGWVDVASLGNIPAGKYLVNASLTAANRGGARSRWMPVQLGETFAPTIQCRKEYTQEPDKATYVENMMIQAIRVGSLDARS